MEKFIKLFPFLPQKDDVGKLVIALVFYVFAPSAAAMILGFILGITFIGLILVPFVSLAASAYTICGVVFAIMSFIGKDIVKK